MNNPYLSYCCLCAACIYPQCEWILTFIRVLHVITLTVNGPLRLAVLSIYIPSPLSMHVLAVSVNELLPSPVFFHVFTVSVNGPLPLPVLFHVFTVNVNVPYLHCVLYEFTVSVSGSLPSPVLSILLAVFTLSPNKQYLGILIPTTPATQGPAESLLIESSEC